MISTFGTGARVFRTWSQQVHRTNIARTAGTETTRTRTTWQNHPGSNLQRRCYSSSSAPVKSKSPTTRNDSFSRTRSPPRRHENTPSMESLDAIHRKIMHTPASKQHEKVRFSDYLSLMDGWMQLSRSDRVLEVWHNLPSEIIPTEAMVHKVMKTLVKDRRVRDKGVQAEIVFQQMQERWAIQGRDNSPQNSYKPSVVLYNTVLNAWSKSTLQGDDNNGWSIGKRAENWFRRMEHDHVKPDVVSYASIINAYSRCSSPNDAQRMLHDLLAKNLQPNVIVYTSVMSAWFRSSNSLHLAEAPERVEALWDDMISNNIQPSPQTYSIIMTAWAKSGRKNAPEQIQRWIDSMLVDTDMTPNIYMWNALLHAWAKSGRRESGERATEIVRVMKTNFGVEPDVAIYNTWMDAITKSGEPEAAYLVDKILHDMENDYFLGRSNVAPDDLTYSAVLQSWAKSGFANAPERCFELLEQMQRSRYGNKGRRHLRPVVPNTQCYDAVIDCWARSGRPEAVRIAIDLLNKMEQLSTRKGSPVEPSVRTYNAVLTALARAGKGDKAQAVLEHMLRVNVRPNVHCYSNVITAYANSTPPNPTAALDVLRWMTQQPDCKPNVVSYSSAIAAFAKVGDTSQAKPLLDEMVNISQNENDVQMMPNIVTINSVLEAFANVQTIESAEKAEEFLNAIPTNYANIQPDVVSYSTVMLAWANLGEGARAERILDKMEEAFQQSDDSEKMRTNIVSYTTAIKAWAKSRDLDAPAHVDRILDKLNNHVKLGRNYLKPNQVTMTTAISTYTNDQHKGKFVAKAQQLLHKMIQEFEDGDESMKPPKLAFQMVRDALMKLGDQEEALKVEEQEQKMLKAL